MKSYLFSYEFQGQNWNFEIPAHSQAEAMMRLSKIAQASFDGEAVLKVAASKGPVSSILARVGL